MLAVCLVCCWGASRLPDAHQRRLRAGLLDGCLPFQEAKVSIKQFWASRWPATDDRLATLESKYQSERVARDAEHRRLELTIAELKSRAQLDQLPEAFPVPIVSAAGLIEYDLVSAGIVAPQQLRFVQRELLIRSEELTDLERDSLVIQAVQAAEEDEAGPKEFVLDQGETTGFEPEQPVFAGRCVVGSLAEVGHWISRVRLLTDPEYRGRARILRQVEDGFVYGPEGILVGTGETFCRLRYLSDSESVPRRGTASTPAVR